MTVRMGRDPPLRAETIEIEIRVRKKYGRFVSFRKYKNAMVDFVEQYDDVTKLLEVEVLISANKKDCITGVKING